MRVGFVDAAVLAIVERLGAQAFHLGRPAFADALGDWLGAEPPLG